MKKYLSVLLPAALIALPCTVNLAAAAQPVHPVDVKSFDVAGVKTGMSVAEARSAMQKNFGVSADKIVASDSMDFQTPTTITGSKQVMHLVYENEGTRMQVSFEPRVPYNKANPMAAALITYEMPWSQANHEAMKKAAIAKYGPVSISSVAATWCEKPIPGSGMGCESGTAELTQSSTKITLIDPAWQNAVNKYMDEKKSSKPQF